jgi:RNA polymerase sigma factor (sigma-70 family)
MLEDRQLVADLLGSNRDSALAECVRRYGPMVKRSAWRITGDEHLAEDVCQAVFFVLLRKAASLTNVNLLGAWLYRVAVTAARDVVKMQARRQKREQESAMKPQAQNKLTTTLLKGIDDAVSRLPDAYRQVIVAHYFQGQSYAEVGDKLGLPEETVKKRGNRGIHRLRKSLAATVPGLTVVTLGSVLAAEAAAASAAPLPAATVAAIQASAVGGASSQVASIADATIKAMSWAKLQILGTAAAATLGTAAVLAVLLPSRGPAWQAQTTINVSPIISATFSSDGRYCATGTADVSLWDLNSGRKLAGLPHESVRYAPPFHALAFSPDGKTIAAAGTGRIVQLWDRDSGKLQGSFDDGLANKATYLVFSPDGQALAVADVDGGVCVCDIPTGKIQFRTVADRAVYAFASLAFSPDGKLLATTQPGGGAVRLWKWSTGEAVASLAGLARPGAIAFSSDGQLLAATSLSPGPAKVWDVNSGKERLSLATSQETLARTAVTFSRDGKLLAAFDIDGRITIWEAASGQTQATLDHGGGQGFALAFGPDNKTLLAASQGSVKRWTASGGKLK